MRLIAGDLDGNAGPGVTYTPITLLHATIAPGGSVTLPWREDFNALVYGLSGRGSVGAERRPLSWGQLAVFGDGSSITISADSQQDSRDSAFDVYILGGQPIREPVAAYGPSIACRFWLRAATRMRMRIQCQWSPG